MEQGTLISHPIGEESRPIKWIGAEEKPCYSECWFQLPNHWNFHYLSTKVGEKMVKVARGILPNPTIGYEDANLYHEMSFSEFISHLTSNDENKEVLYLRQVPLYEELKSDLKELHEDEFENFLWIGEKGSKSPLHYDLKHNLHTVLRGTKLFIIIPPNTQDEFLYPYPADSRLPRFSQVELRITSDVQTQRDLPISFDASLYPLFKQVNALHAVVKEGQTLYIPSGWWHFVVNLTDTIALNHWWRSQPAPSANNHVSSAPHHVAVHENGGDDMDTLRRLQKEIEHLNREMISCLKSIKTSAACQSITEYVLALETYDKLVYPYVNRKSPKVKKHVKLPTPKMKSKSQHGIAVNKLGMDVWMLVFSFLDKDSLNAAHCVCKQWKSILEHPSFVAHKQSIFIRAQIEKVQSLKDPTDWTSVRRSSFFLSKTERKNIKISSEIDREIGLQRNRKDIIRMLLWGLPKSGKSSMLRSLQKSYSDANDLPDTPGDRTAFSETRLVIDGYTFKFVLPASTASSRRTKKVLHSFDDVYGLLFVVDLSNLQSIPAAIQEFSLVNNDKCMTSATTTLLLNKWDIFQTQFSRDKLVEIFPEYSGGGSTEEAVQFIKQKFSETNTNTYKSVYCHKSIATDTISMESIFKALKDIHVWCGLADLRTTLNWKKPLFFSERRSTIW